MKPTIVIILLLICSCQQGVHSNTKSSVNVRKEILGRNFKNSDVRSIDIITIERKQLNLKKDSVHLSEFQKIKFLNEFDGLREKGIFKCAGSKVVYFNFKKDTISIGICGSLVREKNSNNYYELENGKSIVAYFLR